MTTYHVWGDYVHTLPERIGNATLHKRDDDAAKRTARESGFDIERRTRNGFEPWAATFVSESDHGQEDAFAADPIVRGWKRL
jgi:hypothetical protein